MPDEKARLINSGLRFGWIDNEDDWNHTGVDLNWQWIDALMARTVLDIRALPISGLTPGMLYIEGQIESTTNIKLALRVVDLSETGVATERWDYLTPVAGMEFHCLAKNTKLRFDGSKWVTAQPISISFFAGGLLEAEQVIAKWFAPVPFDFTVKTVGGVTSLPNCYASCQTETTGAVTISIRRNNLSIGNIKFVAGSTAGTFEFLANAAFAPGDDLSFIAPAEADETMSGLSVTMLGNRRTV